MHETNDVYDPAFYLPLLCFLLSENNVVSCHKVAQSGALALAFVACSSKHSDVRMVAYTIITRYYTHLEASRYYIQNTDRTYFMHAIIVIIFFYS